MTDFAKDLARILIEYIDKQFTVRNEAILDEIADLRVRIKRLEEAHRVQSGQITKLSE